MATQHGIPGEWARVRGTLFAQGPLFLALFLLGAFTTALILGERKELFGLLFVCSILHVAFAWRKGIRRVTSFFVGARGEERVASVLADLPAVYHVFHDFVGFGVPVDHVVVGPTGVFAIETKNWQGEVTLEKENVLLNGTPPKRNPVRQALKEAESVRSELVQAGWSGSVTPVLCFASDRLVGDRAEARGVTLVNARRLLEWFAARPTTLEPKELERLVQLVTNK